MKTLNEVGLLMEILLTETTPAEVHVQQGTTKYYMQPEKETWGAGYISSYIAKVHTVQVHPIKNKKEKIHNDLTLCFWAWSQRCSSPCSIIHPCAYMAFYGPAAKANTGWHNNQELLSCADFKWCRGINQLAPTPQAPTDRAFYFLKHLTHEIKAPKLLKSFWSVQTLDWCHSLLWH